MLKQKKTYYKFILLKNFMEQISHFIDGKIFSDNKSRKGKVFNPATGEQIAEVELASKDIVRMAVESSSKAFVKWSKTTPITRARIFSKYKDLLFQNMSELGLEPLVNDLLKNGDSYARRVATDAMGRTGRMAVLPYLVKCMDDDDMYVRWQAAKGLGRFAGSSDARDALVGCMDDSEPYVRKRVARSLESFGGAGPIDEKVEGPMEEDGKGDIDGDGISDSEDEEPRIADDKPNYSSMTVAELKKVLKEKGLSVSGKKADLISRLEE